MSENILVLLSGGLDSSVLFKFVEKEMALNPVSIFFDRYQKAIREEEEAAKWVCRSKPGQPYIVSIREWRMQIQAVPMECIPRNAIMIFLAVPFALANSCKQIAIGSNLSDACTPDSSEPFICAVNKLLKLTTRDVELVAPFIDKGMNKKDIVAWANSKLGMEFIKHTHSCFMPSNGKPCNSCTACRSRYEAIDSLQNM